MGGPAKHFFCLMAAWLNEGRCPGGRPSVSTNYITIEASVFCIEMTTVHREDQPNSLSATIGAQLAGNHT